MIDRIILSNSGSTEIAQELRTSIQEIASTEVPSTWIEEGSAQPIEACRIKTCQVVIDLFETYRLIPHRVGPSRIGGILVTYRHDGSDLELEVDNELDVMGVLSTDKKVIDSAELSGPEEWRDFVRR